MTQSTAIAPSTPSSNGSAGSQARGTTSLAKATIVNKDKGGPPITCLFNPKEYAFTKSNKWTTGDTKGTNVPQLEFGGGQPATLQLQLFFDTYASGKDVRKEHTDALWELMMVDPSLTDPKSNKGRPCKVGFHWGEAWSFDAVITKLTQKFTLFLSTGTPVRAICDVTFQQIADSRALAPTNPTSGGVGGTRLWTVQEGDTLAWMSYKHYGDATQWRRIADANRLTHVRRLRPGTVLEIPSA
jgi:nucleoid-associated protein YgaU